MVSSGGKGGGAWKVAYADFVTAMMAFFLVMWLCAQNQQVKSAVADYFGDPFSSKRGTSKSPYRQGAVLDSITAGSVPKADSVALGQGRNTYTTGRLNSVTTKLVSDWLNGDTKTVNYWREQALRQRELARRVKGPQEKPEAVDALAAQALARQLRDEVTRDVRGSTRGLHQDLLFEVVSEINWSQLAEDVMAKE